MEITADILTPYLDKQRHAGYEQSIKIASRLKPHATGDIDSLANHLLKERRPSELEETFAFRKKIAVRKTKGIMDKVYNCLCKIRKSSDWMIAYDNEFINSKPKLSEKNLHTYCEENLPRHGSLTNWLFNYALKVSMYDPNAVVLVTIESIPADATSYLQPVPITFECDKVLEFNNELFVGLSNEKSKYRVGKSLAEGKVYWVATKTTVHKFVQTSSKGNYFESLRYEHNIGALPAFKLGGQLVDEVNMVYESMFDAMNPYLDECFREYSDLQSEVLLHIFSTQWIYETQNCTVCGGKGMIVAKGKTPVVCSSCNGGKVAASPYKRIIVSPPASGEESVPTPPMGYVEKNTNIVELQDKRIRNHEYDALACFNMEFLAKVPASQSGIAKSLDREELTTFVNLIAEQRVQNLDLCYFFINEWMFSLMLPNADERKKQLPKIAVPERFDLIGSQYYLEEIKLAIDSQVNPLIVKELQLEYASKKFTHDDDVRETLELLYKHDPLGAMTQDDKIVAAAQRWVTEHDVIKSTMLHQFVKEAERETSDFERLPFEKQEEILNEKTKNYILSINGIVDGIETESGAANSESNQLRNTVGGLTGMIEIAKAVADGVYDLEAAIALVADRFGITTEQARAQLGTPSKPNEPTV